jgi:hypothetical protein
VWRLFPKCCVQNGQRCLRWCKCAR